MNNLEPNPLNKAVNISHAINQLKSERPNISLRYSDKQVQGINWITTSFPPYHSFTVDIAKWRNN